MTNEQRTMGSVAEQLRRESPKLERRLRENLPRHRLALALVAMRRLAGLTQKQVAAAMGRDQAYVSRMESSRGPMPRATSIEAYATACHANAGYIFVSDEPIRPEIVTVPLGGAAEGGAIDNAIARGGR